MLEDMDALLFVPADADSLSKLDVWLWLETRPRRMIPEQNSRFKP